MERFTRALDAPDANRVDVRIEFAKLFVREGKFNDAKQEVGLAFAESRIGEASPVTADNLVEAANIFLAAHDFDLAERYFAKAKDLGASDDTVAIGLANTYIAQGKDRKAEEELAALGKSADYEQSYDYQLAWATSTTSGMTMSEPSRHSPAPTSSRQMIQPPNGGCCRFPGRKALLRRSART